ncbi:DoxX family protein [Chryseolinea lacunae]|uniref:DoxX family protein n=1 Tax=Chryseolinea lacunae TaxID=2801331 RepID=A0ABS1KZB4_9BACT|nr:DoxX family protein [Chryseolinea lacunae]MBL0744680.1 DoxX family protein [Chryseolinea lacunae]
MSISGRLNHAYDEAKGNKWLRYFAVFCRVVLALGFIPSGIVKVMGERFASGLSVNHPLGHYLEALHRTEYYYTFIGISQLLIAVLLLIPRTALLGALMYFPIILNICILAYAVRFEGTRITTLMLLANIFLLCWDYNRIKHILPFKQTKEDDYLAREKPVSHKFPSLFFGGVFVMIAAVIIINHFMYDIRPGNSRIECTNGCAGNSDPKACLEFCGCIHDQGKQLHECLNEYDKAKE